MIYIFMESNKWLKLCIYGMHDWVSKISEWQILVFLRIWIGIKSSRQSKSADYCIPEDWFLCCRKEVKPDKQMDRTYNAYLGYNALCQLLIV